MIKLAVIGHPLTQSLSSVMHNAMFKELGIEGNYETLETQSEELVDRLKYLKANEYTGFNVTIPLKVPVVLFMDEFDDIANAAGCANTVKIMPDKSLYGYNTDIYGFQTAIPEEFRKELKGSKVSILGTGGAARAAAIALCQLGVSDIDFYARNILNASSMVNSMREQFYTTKFNLKQMQSVKDLSDVKLLVNSTPIGMKGKAPGFSPIDERHMKTLPEGAVVYDIVYNPVKTKFIQFAQKNGYETISGLDMFVHQGAKAFEIWTGYKAKPDVMKLAALEHLIE